VRASYKITQELTRQITLKVERTGEHRQEDGEVAATRAESRRMAGLIGRVVLRSAGVHLAAGDALTCACAYAPPAPRRVQNSLEWSFQADFGPRFWFYSSFFGVLKKVLQVVGEIDLDQNLELTKRDVPKLRGNEGTMHTRLHRPRWRRRREVQKNVAR